MRPATLALHALTREFAQLGWKVDGGGLQRGKYRAGASIMAGGHRYWIHVEEMCDRLDFTQEDIEAWRNSKWKFERESRVGKFPPPQVKRRKPTGLLRYTLTGKTYEPQRTLKDTVRFGPVSDRLHEIVAEIHTWIARDDRRAVEAKLAAAERERRAELERARQLQVALDQRRAKRLLAEATDWEQAMLVRRYADALDARVDDLPEDEQARIGEWTTWARLWANQVDPTVSLRRVRGLEEHGDRWY